MGRRESSKDENAKVSKEFRARSNKTTPAYQDSFWGVGRAEIWNRFENDRAILQKQIDTPDQRITTDLGEFLSSFFSSLDFHEI